MYSEVIARTNVRLEQIQLLSEVINDPTYIRGREADFIVAMERITWRNFPVINGNTYNEMLTTGNMTLLRSEALRKQLSDYYAMLEDTERLSFGEDDQDQFRNETLGILSAAMLKYVEDEEMYPLEVSEETALAMANEFSTREKAHWWMNRLAKYQVLMANRSTEFTKSARSIQTEIQNLL